MVLRRYGTGEDFRPPAWCFRVLLMYYLQLHSVWEPEQSACVLLNTEGSQKTVIVAFVSDVVLLLTMLVGLLRMRLRGDMSGLRQLLWNQVGKALYLLSDRLYVSRERV